MKRQQTRTLNEILEQILNETELANGLEILRINHAWNELIGETAAILSGKGFIQSGLNLPSCVASWICKKFFLQANSTPC